MGNPKRWESQRSQRLADDLIISEILTRLPAKSVGRFRCVSKRWLSGTSQPEFALAHASRARASGFFLFTAIDGRAEHFPLDGDDGSRIPDPFLSSLDHEGRPPLFCDSCNGLVLLLKSQLCGCCVRKAALCVANPLTGAHHVLPTPPRIHPMYIRSSHLYFDPLVSSHFNVFCIVVYAVRAGEPHTFIHMYFSETREWKQLHQEPGRKYTNSGCFRSVASNGCLVWHSFGDKLLCVDVKTEEVKFLPSPSMEEEFWCRYFGESGGRLHYITEPETVTQESITHFDILEFNPDASEWFVLHKVDLDSIKDVYPEVNAEDLAVTIRVLCFLRGDGRVGDRLLLGIPGRIVGFHLGNKSFTTVCSGLPEDRKDVSWPGCLFPHALSLFFPNTEPDTSISWEDWVFWKREHDKLLMDLMVDHALKGQRHDNNFNKGAWDDMVEKLNAATQLTFNVKHLENRLRSYRKDYRAVDELLKAGEFHWNPSLEMVIAGDAAWREHLKVRSDAAYYRRRQVPFKALGIICGSPPVSCHGTSTLKIEVKNRAENVSEQNATRPPPADPENVDEGIQDGAETTESESGESAESESSESSI